MRSYTVYVYGSNQPKVYMYCVEFVNYNSERSQSYVRVATTESKIAELRQLQQWKIAELRHSNKKKNYAGVITPQAWIKETETLLSDSEVLTLPDWPGWLFSKGV